MKTESKRKPRTRIYLIEASVTKKPFWFVPAWGHCTPEYNRKTAQNMAAMNRARFPTFKFRVKSYVPEESR